MRYGELIQEFVDGVPPRLNATITATCGVYYFYNS